MQRQTSKPVQQPSAEPAHARKKGPTPLDPSDLEKVGGGSPKGGWCLESARTVKPLDDTSPKGGW
jgi:hypothetical protein